MSHATDSDDDDGYYGYVPTAVSLGPGLLAGAVLATMVAYGFILPFLVTMGGRREAQQQTALEDAFIQEGDDHNNDNRMADPQEGCSKGDYLAAVPHNNKRRRRRSKHQKTDSKTGSKSVKSHHQTDDEVSCSGESITSSQKSSSSNHSSELSSAVAAILDQPRAPKNKKQRKRRRIKEKQVFATTARGRNRNNNLISDNSQNPDMVSILQAIHPGAIPVNPAATAVAKSESNNSEMEDDFLEDTVSRPHFSATQLSRSDETMSGYPHLQRAGDFAKLGVLDKITTISAWDMELKRILKLSMPYCTQALITGVTDTLNVAVIGKLIGTREGKTFL